MSSREAGHAPPPAPKSQMRERDSRAGIGPGIAYPVLAITWIALLWYAAGGIRGSDQFWYLRDTETLLAGGPPVTNTVYPGPLLREGVPAERTYFLHHTLVMHLVLPLARVFGAYGGWIVFNGLSVLLAAALVAWTLHRLCGLNWGLAGFGLTLFLPLTFWQAANLLQEAALFLITAVLTTLYLFAGRNLWCWVLLLGVAAAAVLCHAAYLPAVLLLLAAFVGEFRRRLRPSHHVVAAAALALTFFFSSQKNHWFPNTTQPDLKAILVEAYPGRTNCEWHYSVTLPPLTAGVLLRKVINAIVAQVPLTTGAIFAWPTNLLVLLALPLVRFAWREPLLGRLGMATLAWILLWILLVVMHQNQFRYQLIIIAPLITCALVSLQRLTAPARWRPNLPWAAGVLLLVMAAADLHLAHYLRDDSQRTAAELAQVRASAGAHALGARGVIENVHMREELLLSYALYPRLCLMLQAASVADAELPALVEAFGPEFLVCGARPRLPERLPAEPVPITWPKGYTHLRVYRLSAADEARAGRVSAPAAARTD